MFNIRTRLKMKMWRWRVATVWLVMKVLNVNREAVNTYLQCLHNDKIQKYKEYKYGQPIPKLERWWFQRGR